MKLEDQVASLELSRKLKEAGYPQEGLFWWVDCRDVKNRGWKLFYEKDEDDRVKPVAQAEVSSRHPKDAIKSWLDRGYNILGFDTTKYGY